LIQSWKLTADWRFLLSLGLALLVLLATAYVSPLFAWAVERPLGSVARVDVDELGTREDAEDETSLKVEDATGMYEDETSLRVEDATETDEDWSIALDEISTLLDAGGLGSGESIPAVLYA
jgi:hypothetical protein